MKGLSQVMSSQAQRWVRTTGKRYRLDPGARHIMRVLADYTDRDGNIDYLPLSALEDDTGMSARNLRRVIDGLLRAGLLVRVSRHPNTYRFPMQVVEG